jgi:2-C-methyl-D-erythritol 4-phosphate cytidylyltransferase
VAVTPETRAAPRLCERHPGKSVRLVPGGSERWQSVRHGVEALSSQVAWALVHDVARPFVSRDILSRCIETVRSGEGCIVARACADTVKRVGADGLIQQTLDRREIWLAQTPQCFRVADLRQWYERARTELDFTPTDEASLAEHFGAPVRVVAGDTLNDKITTPEDLQRFRSLWETGLLGNDGHHTSAATHREIVP